MAERVIALYFEDTGIKLLVAKGRKAEQWASLPLEPGLVVGGVIVDETRVANKVKEIFTTIKNSPIAGLVSGKGKLIVGLSGRDSLYRVISLPVLEKSILAEAVRREAGRVLPVSLDQLYLAFQRIPGNENETRIFVAAFPKKATDVLIKTLRLAGVTLRVLDLAPLALCLSLNEPRAIIADARLDNLNIMVIAERVPQVIRSLSLQSEETNVTGNMANISEEFSRTVAFYNSSHQQAPLDSDVPVFVSGDLASAPDTWTELVGKLNSKVAVLPSAIQYPEDFPVNEFIVNLGLATKELGLEKEPGNYSLVNLNALPASALPKPINPYRIIVPVVAVVGIVSVFYLWNTWQTTKKETTALQSQLTSNQNQITNNNKALAALTEQNRLAQTEIQPIIDAANVFNTKLTGITAARTLMDNEVHQIIALKPTAVNLTGMNYSADGKMVTGSAENAADILSYAQALRDSGAFTTVVSSIDYSPIVDTDTGAIIPVYNFMLQMQ
jgi:type IV pilus assembly protein PilM